MLKKLITPSSYSEIELDLIKVHKGYNLYVQPEKRNPKDNLYLEFAVGYVVPFTQLTALNKDAVLDKVDEKNYTEFFMQMFSGAYDKGSTIPVGYCEYLIEINLLPPNLLEDSINKNIELKARRMAEVEALKIQKKEQQLKLKQEKEAERLRKKQEKKQQKSKKKLPQELPQEQPSPLSQERLEELSVCSIRFKRGQFISNSDFIDLCQIKNVELTKSLKDWLVADVVEIAKDRAKAKTLNSNISSYLGVLYEAL